MGRQMTPQEYFRHWTKRKVWTHLVYPKHQKRLLWCADHCVGDSYADVGCALGHSTDIMRRRRLGRWTGVDFSKDAVDGARKLFPDMSIPRLHEIGRFDTVVCSEVIEHVPDDRALLLELLAMARRRVVITTPTVDAHDPGHVRFYTMGSLTELFRKVGAPVEVDILQDDPFFYITVDGHA
jgi:2-polyprenyl-3-methyl-5-hydroxy-6-metoxy-1,4-benzoquinol methylase